MTNNLVEYAKKNGGVISAADYRALISGKNPLTKKDSNLKKSEKYNFAFKLEVLNINPDEYKFSLIGRHHSTNEINGWLSFGKRNAYKLAIKQAFYDFFLVNKNLIPKTSFEKSVMYSIAYNKSSRDDDGNRISLKAFRDMLTEYGFIVDDSRKYFFEMPNFEVLSKDYKLEIYLKKITTLPTLSLFKDSQFFL